MRPERMRKMRYQSEGDDLDLDGLVEHVVDRRAGITPTDRVYNKRDKKDRDVTTAFLVDMSSSTDRKIDGRKRIIDIEKEGLIAHVERVGAHLRSEVDALSARVPGLTGARGRGLLAGVGVDPSVIDRAAIIDRCRKLGLLITQAGPDALRFTPPYIVSRSHVDDAVATLERALKGEGA
jgi:4-aminobutyrate aminotransferase-like enzyme